MTTHEKYVPELTEEELDSMLAQWADTELDVPEGFHESVMMRLRAEESKQTQTVQALQQKGKIVSLAERFANKKVWISTIAAAALVVCCLPVLQDRQDYLAGIENSDAQAYEMRSRIVENDDEMSEEPVMVNAMLVDAQASPAANGTMNDAADVVGSEDLPQQSFVTDVAFVELDLLAGEFFHTVQALGVGVAQIVDDHHAVAAFQQLHTGVAADISGAAGNKNRHKITLQIII